MWRGGGGWGRGGGWVMYRGCKDTRDLRWVELKTFKMPRWLQDEEKLVAAHTCTHLAKLWQQHKVFGPVCPQHEDIRAPNTPASSMVLLADYRHPLPGPQGPFPSCAMKKKTRRSPWIICDVTSDHGSGPALTPCGDKVWCTATGVI